MLLEPLVRFFFSFSFYPTDNYYKSTTVLNENGQYQGRRTVTATTTAHHYQSTTQRQRQIRLLLGESLLDGHPLNRGSFFVYYRQRRRR